MNLEAQLQSSSIIPYTESYIREAFTAILQDKRVAAEKRSTSMKVTLFRGRVDIVIFPTDLASPSVPGDDDDAVKCASVQLKRPHNKQGTQQCLAECHAFLACVTVIKALVDRSTGYTLELHK